MSSSSISRNTKNCAKAAASADSDDLQTNAVLNCNEDTASIVSKSLASEPVAKPNLLEGMQNMTDNIVKVIDTKITSFGGN